jgi:hypothetical protein
VRCVRSARIGRLGSCSAGAPRETGFPDLIAPPPQPPPVGPPATTACGRLTAPSYSNRYLHRSTATSTIPLGPGVLLFLPTPIPKFLPRLHRRRRISVVCRRIQTYVMIHARRYSLYRGRSRRHHLGTIAGLRSGRLSLDGKKEKRTCSRSRSWPKQLTWIDLIMGVIS